MTILISFGVTFHYIQGLEVLVKNCFCSASVLGAVSKEEPGPQILDQPFRAFYSVIKFCSAPTVAKWHISVCAAGDF